MGLLLWILFGALVGWAASAIMGSGQGLLMDIVVGICGAVVGGWIMSLLGYGGVSGFDLYSFIVALIGALVLFVIVRSLRKR